MGNRGVTLNSVVILQVVMQLLLTTITIWLGGGSIVKAFKATCSRDRKLMLVNSFACVVTLTVINSSFLALPMSIAMTIFATIPFCSAILSCVFLREPLAYPTIIAMFISFCAILILGFAKHDDQTQASISDRSAQKYNTLTYTTGIVLALISAFSISTILVTNRMLQKVETTTIQFNSNFLSTIVFGIWTLIKYLKQNEIPFSYQEGGYWTIVLLFAGAFVGFAS